jgi:hypothetical protein
MQKNSTKREKNMKTDPALLGPCGLSCGICAVYMADRDNNIKFKERLVALYSGKIEGKGKLPSKSAGLTVDDIKCSGCLSDNVFIYCQKCKIKECTKAKGYTGCHECNEFPCDHIENFPMNVGKKVILRAIPHLKKVGTKKFIKDEEARYICPECGNKIFRGAGRCNKCKISLDLD